MPPEIVDEIVAVFPDGATECLRRACDAPSDAGAYLLAMYLDAPRALAGPRWAGRRLDAGWYVYAGSAYGLGGLRARLARHFRRDKARRWHVDELTVAAVELIAHAFPGGNECDLRARLAARPGFSVPLSGFGSSDCRHCPAHLLAWRPKGERREGA